MAKFSWKVFKKGKPIYWVIGAIILFVIFYFIASSGSKGASSGGVTTINAGPSDAQIAAGAATTHAQIQSATAQNIAGLELAGVKEKIAGDVAIAGLSAKVQELNLTTSLEALQVQSEYSLESARVASQTNLAMAGLELKGLELSTAANIEALRIASQGDLAMAAMGAATQQAQIAGAVKQTEIQSLTQIALGAQGADVAKAQIMSAAQIASLQLVEGTKQIQSQLSSNERVLIAGLNTQERITSSNNAASLSIATIQADYLTDAALIDAAGNMKKKDRDNFLFAIATGAPYRGTPGTGVPAI